ncbi:MAG TPA: ketopantoate reductase family protein, partial [Anaeromyxobacteraceae bacterium]|nr:ketopantoate reductase family protein [Anaeromyxobacteraceae bacterium]
MTSPPARVLERVVICGAGAVGSAYAALLHDLAPDRVALVAGGARRARLEREGLTVNGRRLAFRCLAPGDASFPADLLLVAVKQHHLAQAVADARAVVGDGTLILSLLNGISSEAVLAAAYGAEKVLPAFVVGNDLVRDGTATRYTRIGQLVFGAPSNDPADPRVVAVRALLDRAGIPCAVPADILREQWWKFLLNVGVNQVSAVLRAPYRAFALPEVQDLVRRAALEVVAVAGPEGVGLGPADVERIFPILATLGPEGKTSMLQDVEAGRKTEV